MAYIYPDFETAFVGWFDDDRMINAREGRVSGCRLDESTGVMRLLIEVVGSNRHGYGRESRELGGMCSFPTERDPYERKMVDCRLNFNF